jgi:hypothetical protein
MSIKTLCKVSGVVLAGLVLAMPLTSYAQTAIIEKERGAATIYVDAKAPATVLRAATDLQSHLKQITDVELPISSDLAGLKGYVIYLGDTPIARKQGIDVKQLPSDGYRILSNKNWMIIAGKDYGGPPMTGFQNPFRLNESYNSEYKFGAFGDAGTMFGVYHFLEQYCGVRWYMPGPLGTVIQRKNKIVVPALNVKKAPHYPQRHAYYGFMDRSNDDTLWYRRAGYGSPAPVQVMHSFGFFFHKYKDTNPEFFALIDGKRDFTNLSSVDGDGNYNLSDPGLLQAAINEANKYFDENPGQTIFPLCPPDGMTRISEDPVSQAQIDMSQGPGGQYSNYVWGFVNKVAKGIQKTHPDKFVGCFAYERYSKPPTNIDKLEPNVVLVITKMRAAYPKGTVKQDVREKIAAWKKKASTIYCWEYYCNPLFNPNWRGYPMFFSKLLQEDLQWLKDTSRGEFIEAESFTPDQYGTAPEKIKINYPGVDHLLLYLTARLLWNPDLDVKATLGEYYKLFYGPAEKPMREFWEAVEDNWNQKGWQSSPTQVYNTAIITKLLASLKEAKAKTSPDSIYGQRIELISSEFSPAAKIAQRLGKLVKPAIDVPAVSAPPAEGNPLPTLATSSPVLPFLDRGGSSATPATNAQVGWDADNLYVDVRCYEPNMDKLKVSATKRDSGVPPIWDDDCVEIFVAPDAAAPEKGVHYIINAAGTLFDSKTNGILGQEDTNWNGNAKVLVQRETGRWVVRVSIPWTDLGLENVKAGHKISGNFYRTRYAGEELVESGWAPMREASYYSPQDFGTLTLQDKAPAAAALANPTVIQPTNNQEYGSGAALQGLYYEGGVPNVGLFLGHANPSPRGDRVLVKFDLKSLLETGDKIEKVELVFGILSVTGPKAERDLNIRYFAQPVGALDADVLGSEDTENLTTVKAVHAEGFALTNLNGTPFVPHRVDVTALVKGAVAKGQTSMTFRWQDVLAEQELSVVKEVGVGLSENGSGGLPSLVISMK